MIVCDGTALKGTALIVSEHAWIFQPDGYENEINTVEPQLSDPYLNCSLYYPNFLCPATFEKKRQY